MTFRPPARRPTSWSDCLRRGSTPPLAEESFQRKRTTRGGDYLLGNQRSRTRLPAFRGPEAKDTVPCQWQPPPNLPTAKRCLRPRSLRQRSSRAMWKRHLARLPWRFRDVPSPPPYLPKSAPGPPQRTCWMLRRLAGSPACVLVLRPLGRVGTVRLAGGAGRRYLAVRRRHGLSALDGHSGRDRWLAELCGGCNPVPRMTSVES